MRPDIAHNELVDVPHLLHRQKWFGSAVAWTVRFLVHPPRRLRVTGDFHVFLELFVAHGFTLLKQLFDLFEDEGVAFESGRMMCFLVPDLLPDLLGLFRHQKAAEPRPKLGHLRRKPVVDRCAGLAASGGHAASLLGC